MLRPVNVAIAAPVTPSFGKGPQPKIRHGSRTRLMMFDTHSRRMAIAASPAPRNIALLRNSSMIAPLPPSAMRAYQPPTATICGDAPIKLSRSEEHTSELQSHLNLVCRLLLEKKKKK